MSKLTYEQYKQKMTTIIPKIKISEENDLKAAYEEYCNLSDMPIIDQMKIDLRKNNFFVEVPNVKGYFSHFWLRLSDFSKFLLKELPNYKFFYDKSNIHTWENAMIIPRIVRASGLESAEYYVITWVMDDSVETWEDNFFLTPSFLQENDELISFGDIMENSSLDIITLENSVRQYLELRHFSKENIKNFIKEFRKTIFMSEFIANTDTTTENISFIVNGKKVRMAPMYDFDFCAGNDAILIRRFKVGNKAGIQAVTDYYKSDPSFVEWVRSQVLSINIEELLSKKFESQNQYGLNEKQKELYSNFFAKQKEIIKLCIDKSPENYRERD